MVIIDFASWRVDVYTSHVNGRMKCLSYGVEYMAYDHLDELVCQDLKSIDFATFPHSRPPVISCSDHGIARVEFPWSERSSRSTAGFEAMVMEVLISTGVKSASRVPGITWNEAWHIMQKAAGDLH